MKNKKGFTLIELLAVIVILAILLVIAVPKILNVIDSARANAWQESTALVKHAIEVNTQAPDPSTGTYKYTVKGLCNNETNTDQDVTDSIKKIAKVGAMNIKCKKDTDYIFTLVGTDKFSGRTATISCDSLGKCSVDEITNNGSSNSGGSSSVIEDETGYLYDGYGALTSGNGGDKDFVEELNPEWDVYLRTDGTKLEACAVFTSGTVCGAYGKWDCDYNSTSHTCNNTTGYVMSKKQEAESKGATCHFTDTKLDYQNDTESEYHVFLTCSVENKNLFELSNSGNVFALSELWKQEHDGGGLFWYLFGECSTSNHFQCTNN